MSNPPDRHTPIRLAEAAARAFPDGSMTVSGLRKERDRGRLIVFKVAGKEYTTLAAIDEMVQLCRVIPKQQQVPEAQVHLRNESALQALMAIGRRSKPTPR